VKNPFQGTLKSIPGYGAEDAFVVKLVEAPLPLMQISRSSSTVSISWPTAAAGFVLETTDSLSEATNWIPEATIPLPLGDQNAVTIKIGSGAKFFRLKK